MPRRARIVAAGYPMHAILRGIDRMAIFFADEDNRYFLAKLVELAATESVAVHAYVLMTNHGGTQGQCLTLYHRNNASIVSSRLPFSSSA